MNNEIDVTLWNPQELAHYIHEWLFQYSGFRLDEEVFLDTQRRIDSEEIPHTREILPDALRAPGYSSTMVTIYYMLCCAIGMNYGVDSGHYLDDSTKDLNYPYIVWKEVANKPAKATEFLVRYMIAFKAGTDVLMESRMRLPVETSQVDKKWQDSLRKWVSIITQFSNELQSFILQKQGVTPEEAEEIAIEEAIAEEISPTNPLQKPTIGGHGITFLEDTTTPPRFTFGSDLSISDDSPDVDA